MRMDLLRASGGERPAAAEMQRLLAGFWLTRAIHVTARLGIADLLDEPRSAEDLAKATATNALSLRRVLRFLASVDVFGEDEEGRFTLTPLSATLRAGAPGSLRAWALVVGEQCLPASGGLLHSVQTGETAFEYLNKRTVWEHRAENPEQAQLFDQAMASAVERLNREIVALYDASGMYHVTDIGGGDGSLMVALLQANPHLFGTVFDLPHVAERARERIARSGLADRCTVVEGSALNEVPAGADAYILSRVLHNGDDARSLRILRNCCRAGRETSRLLVIERIAPTRVESSEEARETLSADLNMLVMNGGRERTEAEYRALLSDAGFAIVRVAPTQSFFRLIEAVAAS
jgi:precorrin-6B methylase 2